MSLKKILTITVILVILVAIVVLISSGQEDRAFEYLSR
jgi:hypothetical protein